MSQFTQKSYTPPQFPVAEFANNPEPRCPCLLLLDTSASMSGAPIAELNAGLADFQSELLADPLACRRVEVSVITFGPVAVVNAFETAETFQAPQLYAEGDTPLGSAIGRAIDCVEARKQAYRESGIAYYRPWIFLITDGAPTDDWRRAATRVREGERNKKFMFFAVGVQGADFAVLQKIAVREPLQLDGLKFRELFRWLSNSLSSVSQSQPGGRVLLDNPTGPDGWAAVD